MLLKSVGQEDKIKIEKLDICNDPCSSLTKVMDPKLNQESEKTSISGQELESVVGKDNSSVSEEKVDTTFYVVIQKEAVSLSNKLTNKEPPNVSSVEKSLSFVSNVEAIENQSAEASIRVNENLSQRSESKDPDSRESNEGPLTVTFSFNEKEPSLLSEGSKENPATAHNFESDVSVEVEEVAFVESDNNENDDQPKSPIFGVSLVHQDNKEKAEVEFQSQNKILQIEHMADSGLKDPSSLVEKEDPPRVAEKIVHERGTHNVTPVERCNASRIEPEPETNNGGPCGLSEEKGINSQSDPKESMIEVNKSNEQEATKNVMPDSSLPFKITDAVEDRIQSVSSSKATQAKKSFTFEVNTSSGHGEASKDFQSFPTFQVSNLLKITDGPSTDSSCSQLNAKKLLEVPRSPQPPSGLTSQTKVKGKSDHKPRRKSTGKENSKKTPPATGQVTHFEEVRSHENAEQGITKPGGVFSSPKLRDWNNSSSMFHQPFTDNQQLQLRAQILVYGSLISGSLPEEAHMIAAFGQSDGARTWDGVWRACVERLQVQKAQSKSNNPIQSQPGNRADQGIKHASIKNKVPSSPPISSPMIPLSSPLWNISAPSDNLQPSVIPRMGGRFDYHLTLSPLHPTCQTPPVQNFSGHNPVSWLSQGPFPGQWAARFPPLPITPVKESGSQGITYTPNPTIYNAPPIASPNQPSSDSKSRKLKEGIILPVSVPCSPSVAVSMPTHDATSGDQNKEKVVISEETLNKVEESKFQAVEATKHAENATQHCNNVWSQLEKQYRSGLNPDNEAKLVSSAVSIAAAASVAKAAAAAAKIASDVADQARSMINVFLWNRSQSLDQSSAVSFKTVDISIPDAVLKAAELAAEAVSQAGKIVAMSEPLPLKHLIESGPEGYWKENVETAPEVDKGILNTKLGFSGKEISQGFEKHHLVEVDGISALHSNQEKEKRKPRVHKVPERSQTVEVVPESEIRSIDASSDQKEPKVPLKESNNIKEGCPVEVYRNYDKSNDAWFGGNVLSLKDGKAFVCYTEIRSDEGSGKLKEWVPLEVEGTEVPKIRVAHPMSLEVAKKGRRTTATDFVWSLGDRVDVWMQDCWREGVVVETNKIDVTSLTVQFPGQGETSIVRSWFVRPTLFWKNGKWMECQTAEKHLSSEGDTPQQKRLKLGSPFAESKTSKGSVESFDFVDSNKQEEPKTLNISTHESIFNIGSTGDDKKLNTHKTIRSGLQKEGPRVKFGVPKPGKKQKFMDVSKHFVADNSNKFNTRHDSSIKFTKYLIPQAPGSRGWKTDSRSDNKEKQAAEIKPRTVKPRRPPIPGSKLSQSTIHDSKSGPDSVTDGVKSGEINLIDIGSSSNIKDAPYLVSSLAIPKGDSIKSERSKKRKFTPMVGKVTTVEKSISEISEPRRSNRRIQPTSKLLEGLQSSMTISKMLSASHSTQRSHTKVTPKGSSKND